MVLKGWSSAEMIFILGLLGNNNVCLTICKALCFFSSKMILPPKCFHHILYHYRTLNWIQAYVSDPKIVMEAKQQGGKKSLHHNAAVTLEMDSNISAKS